MSLCSACIGNKLKQEPPIAQSCLGFCHNHSNNSRAERLPCPSGLGAKEGALHTGSQRYGWELLLCSFDVTLGRLYIVSCPLSKCFIKDGGTRGEGAVLGRKAKKEIQLPQENTHSALSQCRPQHTEKLNFPGLTVVFESIQLSVCTYRKC